MIQIPLSDLDVSAMRSEMQDKGISYDDALIASRIFEKYILLSVKNNHPSVYKKVSKSVERIFRHLYQSKSR